MQREESMDSFENPRNGRITHGVVYGYDINSATCIPSSKREMLTQESISIPPNESSSYNAISV
jgi:hypothetical protein